MRKAAGPTMMPQPACEIPSSWGRRLTARKYVSGQFTLRDDWDWQPADGVEGRAMTFTFYYATRGTVDPTSVTW